MWSKGGFVMKFSRDKHMKKLVGGGGRVRWHFNSEKNKLKNKSKFLPPRNFFTIDTKFFNKSNPYKRMLYYVNQGSICLKFAKKIRG